MYIRREHYPILTESTTKTVVSFISIGLISSHHYVRVVTDELLRQRNTCLIKATNIIMVTIRIRFLITPLLSAWHIVGQKSADEVGRWAGN